MFKICQKRCSECLFSRAKIVDDDRKAEILRHCAKTDTHFLCHRGTIAGQEVCCRGFHDIFPHVGNLHRIAQRLGWVELVAVESLKERVVESI